MKRKIVTLLFFVCIALMSLTACSKKPMPPLFLDVNEIELGETVTISMPTEAEPGVPFVFVLRPMEEGLEASISGYTLTLKGTKPGAYSLGFDFNAKGYENGTTHQGVTVLPPVLEAAFATPDKGAPVLTLGDTLELTIESPAPDFTLAVASDSPTVTAVAANSQVTLTAVEVGKAQITVTVSHPDYRDAVLTLEIEVQLPYAPLALGAEATAPATVQVGKTALLPLDYTGQLAITVSDPGLVKAEATPQGVQLTGLQEGEVTLEIISSMDGHQDSRLQAAVTVAPAPAAPAAPAVNEKAANMPDVSDSRFAGLETQILEAVNEERAAVGAPPLTMHATLSKAAALRAKETAEEQSHTRPDGRRGLTVFEDYGVTKFNLKGENLSGSSEVEDGYQIVRRWMNSPSHKAALLDARFTETGVGAYYDGELYRYCQLFGGVVKT